MNALVDRETTINLESTLHLEHHVNIRPTIESDIVTRSKELDKVENATVILVTAKTLISLWESFFVSTLWLPRALQEKDKDYDNTTTKTIER